MIKEHNMKEAAHVLGCFGQGTRAVAVSVMHANGEVKTFLGGADGDLLAMGELVSEISKLKMLGIMKQPLPSPMGPAVKGEPQ
jgi:hypothetical protein